MIDVTSFTFLAETGFAIDGGKILAQLIAFGIVAFVLNTFAFKPLLSTMDERQQKIEDGLKYADDMKDRLDETEKASEAKLNEASEQASKIIAEARENARQFVEKEQQQAIAKAEDIIKKAEHAMELERKQMLAEVRQEVADLVIQTSAVVLQKELSDDEKSRFASTASQELLSRN